MRMILTVFAFLCAATLLLGCVQQAPTATPGATVTAATPTPSPAAGAVTPVPTITPAQMPSDVAQAAGQAERMSSDAERELNSVESELGTELPAVINESAAEDLVG